MSSQWQASQLKKPAPLASRIEQIVVGSAAGDVAGDERHLHADELAERALLDHPLQAIGDVVVAPHVAGLKGDAALLDCVGDLPGIGRPSRHRLFGQDVLAGAGQLDNRRRAVAIGKADDRRIELSAAEQLPATESNRGSSA